MKIDYKETQDGLILIEGFDGMTDRDVKKRFGAEVLRMYVNGLSLSFEEGEVLMRWVDGRIKWFTGNHFSVKIGDIYTPDVFSSIEETFRAAAARLEDIVARQKKILLRTVHF